MATLTPRIDNLERNAIINGNFDFWQRGTSASVVTTTTYQADRFCLVKNFGNATTYARSTDVPTLGQSGFRSQYSLLLTNNASGTAATGTNNYYLSYRMEGLDYQPLHGKQVRLQFWVKNSVVGTYSVGLAGGVSNRSYVTTYTVLAANTWEKKFIDIALDTTDLTNWIFDNTLAFNIIWSLSTGSTRQTSSLNTWSDTFFVGATTDTNTFSNTANATFQLAQVMLVQQNLTVAGATTTDLPYHRAGLSVGHELQMCQRYCYAATGFNSPSGNIGIVVGQCYNTTSVAFTFLYPITMRAAPSFNLDAVGNYFIYDAAATAKSFTGATPNGTGTNGAQVLFTGSSGLVGGNAATLNRSANLGLIYFDAEL